jgi:putative ABC transport system permease protein
MSFKILKKDLLKKKSMNIILTLFVLLATMFIASSVNNLMVVTGGMEKYLDLSGVKDYLIVTMRNDEDRDNENEIIKFIEQSEAVDKYYEDMISYITKSNMILENGESVDVSSSCFISSFSINQQKFFDKDNNEITSMNDGTIYLPKSFIEDNDIEVGDKFTISTKNGWKKEYTVEGWVKDAFLGSEMMGTKRLILSDNDFKELHENSGLPQGSIFSVECNDTKEFKNGFNNSEFNVIFSCDRQTVIFSYIMDMIIAAVLLVVSIFLIVISVIMLRFIIIFNLNEDFRTIGIMKAIGIKNPGIRKMYTAKFLVISISGAILGCALSFPFGNMIIKQFTETIVIENTSANVLLSVIAAVLVAGMVTMFAYMVTRRIKKMSPMDAIRNGHTGERFKKKSPISLSRNKMKTTTYLAINDMFSDIKKFVIMFLTGIVGIWLVIMPINTINTLRSEKIAKWFSVLDCDMYIVDDERVSECVVEGSREVYETYLEEIKTTLEDNGYKVERIFTEVIMRHKVTLGDKSFKSLSLQGIGTNAEEYDYIEGRAPQYDNEVALANATREAISAEVGDTVTINIGDEDVEFIVSGFYQTMNNMGEGIRFNENTELDYGVNTGNFGVQVIFEEDVTTDEIQKLFPNALVETPTEFISSMIGGISDKLVPVKYIVLIIVTIINVLIVVLMQKMFIIKEKSKIAMLKALGFSNKALIAWQTKRIGITLFIGIFLGTATSGLFSQLTSGQVFKMMGATKIDFVINPIEVYVAYPILIFVMTLIASILTMLKVRKITSQDINVAE